MVMIQYFPIKDFKWVEWKDSDKRFIRKANISNMRSTIPVNVDLDLNEQNFNSATIDENLDLGMLNSPLNVCNC